MLFSKICAVIFLFLKYNFNVSMAEAPMCSKFSCEEQLLEKVIRQEIKFEMIEKDIKKTQEIVFNTLEEIKKNNAYGANAMETNLQGNCTEYVKRIPGTEGEKMFKTFEELQNNFTKETEELRKTLTKQLKEDVNKPSIAFFAHNVVDLQLTTDKIIVFTTITTNEGSGYDTSTGIFTAPVAGLYQFNVNYCAFKGKYAPLSLMLSGNVITRSHNFENSQYTSTSFSAVIRVEVGEKVWVKCTSGGSGYGLHQDDWRMNTFSGFLINK